MTDGDPSTEHVRELLHELRGPLAALAALAELADDPVRHDLLDVLDHIRSVVDRAAAPAPLAANRFPVARVLERAAALCRATSEGPGVVVVADAELFALGDPDAAGQILVNLIANALRYSPVDATVTVTANRSGGRVVVEVCDRGPGVALGEAAFAGGVSAEPGRSGIGLTLSRRLAEKMGGSLTLGSQEAGGCLVFDLPAG